MPQGIAPPADEAGGSVPVGEAVEGEAEIAAVEGEAVDELADAFEGVRLNNAEGRAEEMGFDAPPSDHVRELMAMGFARAAAEAALSRVEVESPGAGCNNVGYAVNLLLQEE